MGVSGAAMAAENARQQAAREKAAKAAANKLALEKAAKKKKELEKKKKEEEKNKNKNKPPKVDTSTNKSKGDAPPTQPDKDYKWNLPPHTWSLPIKPEVINSGTSKALGNMEKYRRGRMWWYASNQQEFTGADGKTKKKSLAERKFGFQFLWNPDSYSTAIQLNTEVTPTPLDRFVGVAGAFPSGESITFTLRLDRTNDFACMRHLLERNYNNLNAATSDTKPSKVNTTTLAGIQAASNSNTTPNAFTQMVDFYKTSFTAGITDEAIIAQQIKELIELGTVADIEYLYKAINGDNWHNIAGRKTSDIGFLAATLLRIDIGPLSYVGYVNSLSVNHIAFSQDMTPIRTDLSVSMNLMASAGLGQTQDGQNGPSS